MDTYCALIDEVGGHIREQERTIGWMAKADARAKWLATIPGIGVYFGDDFIVGDRRGAEIFQRQGAV